MAKYTDTCYNCNGKMKEISREDKGDFIQITLQCEDCGATIAVEIEKGAPGT